MEECIASEKQMQCEAVSGHMVPLLPWQGMLPDAGSGSWWVPGTLVQPRGRAEFLATHTPTSKARH